MPGRPRDLTVGVDAGGTKLASVVTTPDGAIVDRRRTETPADAPERVVAAIADVARELIEAHGASAVGVGAAGMIDRSGVVRFSPNVAWRETPLRRDVADAVGVPVIVENDANAAAWGEFRFGAGSGATDMLLVTVGTGIGGGIVIGGELFRGAHGFAAEIGHVVVEPNGPLCGCGNRGCWEQVASGRAIDRRARTAASDDPGSLMVELAGGDPGAVLGGHVSEAARQGDAAAVRVLSEIGERLGVGIAGLVNVLDPDVVVVGGGAVEAGELLLGPARAAFLDAVEAPEHRPEVALVAAALGNDAGAVGAADLARAAVRDGAGR